MADMELKKSKKKKETAACLIIASSRGHHFEPTRLDSLNSVKTNLCSFSSKDRTGRCGTQQNVLLGRKHEMISMEAEVWEIVPLCNQRRDLENSEQLASRNMPKVSKSAPFFPTMCF